VPIILFEADSSSAAGGTGIEIADNCFQEKSKMLAYLLLSSIRELILSNHGERKVQSFRERTAF
jgi:hypothetical protein